MNPVNSTPSELPSYGFARNLYRWRWISAPILMICVLLLFKIGGDNIGRVTASVIEVGDVSNGSGAIPPQMFDPSLDVWFDTGDATVQTYFDIEKTFIAEDYILVSFEDTRSPLGVFSRESLATIQRLTNQFLTVPGVRHVRSLTYSPWIRGGEISYSNGTESGLLISDLVEKPAHQLTEDEIVRRMVAVLGAEQTAEKVGDGLVRKVLGADANFDQYLGEPLLLDSIVNNQATTTAIQIQITRPQVDNLNDQARTDSGLVNKLYAVQYQRAALRGIEHFLGIESGLNVKTSDYLELEPWILSLADGAEKNSLSHTLTNPTKNFMVNQSKKLVKKFHVYRQHENGTYIDIADPENTVDAPSGFSPKALSPYQFKLGGVPVLERNFEVVGMADSKFLPIMFLVVIVALAVLSRSIAGVVVPITVVFASIFGTVGTLFATGTLFNNMTAMLPNMLTAIAIADSIHLVAAWLLMRNHFPAKADLIIEVIRKNTMPVFLTTITTGVGFYSLVLSDLNPVKQLGWAMAVGAALAYLLTMTLVPLLLSLFPHKGVRKHKQRGLFTEAASAWWAALIVRNRRSIVVSSLGIMLIACSGLFFVQIDADQRKMFARDNPVLLDLIWIEDRLGGTGDLEIIFDSAASQAESPALTEHEIAKRENLSVRKVGARNPETDLPPLNNQERGVLEALNKKYSNWNRSRIGVSPEFLGLVERFEARLREEMVKPGSDLAIITDLTSPLDVLRKIHQVQNNDDPKYYRSVIESDVENSQRNASISYDEFTEEYRYTPPQTASSLAAQYYLQYENGARPGENLSSQLSQDRQHFRMQGRGLLCTTQEKQAAITAIYKIAKTEFPSLTSAPNALSSLVVSGKKTLMDRTGIIVASGFVKSISVALLIILIAIAVFFRSWKLGLISALPNVLPIAIPLGVFGWFDIMIDGPAIVVTTVALGVCVDDTIHFFTKYTNAVKAGKDTQAAIAQAVRECGDALTLTTVVLIVGFATMLMSDFSPNYLMGILATSMIALAWLADFIVTPAVLAVFSSTLDSNRIVPQANSRTPAN